eukprot:scaffold2541_cov175-Amphora_coffeaeformis.AAC.14
MRQFVGGSILRQQRSFSETNHAKQIAIGCPLNFTGIECFVGKGKFVEFVQKQQRRRRLRRRGGGDAKIVAHERKAACSALRNVAIHFEIDKGGFRIPNHVRDDALRVRKNFISSCLRKVHFLRVLGKGRRAALLGQGKRGGGRGDKGFDADALTLPFVVDSYSVDAMATQGSLYTYACNLD